MHIAITGASSGIGEALAREFARPGERVTLVARRAENLREIAAARGSVEDGLALALPADLSKPDTATAWIAEAEAKQGPIDVLINNAGALLIGHTCELAEDEVERAFYLNLLAPLRISRAVLPAMIAARKGTIVNISSMAAVSCNPGMHYYAAAKAGLAAASESLRAELSRTGVHVCTVYPGPVVTPMGLQSFAKHELEPSQVPTGTSPVLAQLIRRAIERRQKRVVYPKIYAPGLWLPYLARWTAARNAPPFLRQK